MQLGTLMSDVALVPRNWPSRVGECHHKSQVLSSIELYIEYISILS